MTVVNTPSACGGVVYYGAAGKDFDPGTFDFVQRREYLWNKMVLSLPKDTTADYCGVVTVDLAVGIN